MSDIECHQALMYLNQTDNEVSRISVIVLYRGLMVKGNGDVLRETRHR